MAATLDDLLSELRSQNINLDNIQQAIRSGSSNTGSGGGAGGNASSNDLNFRYIKTSGGELAKSLTQYYLKTDQATKAVGVGLDTFGKKLLDGTKGFNNTLKNSGARFAEQLKSGEITAQDFNSGINENIRELARMKLAGEITRDQYKDLGTQLKRFQNEILTTTEAHQRFEPAINSFRKTWQVFDETALRLTRSYQSSGDGFSTAANLTKDGLSLLSTGTEKAGGYVKQFGGILSNSANPFIAGLGVIAAGAGVGLEAFGAASREVIEKAFPIFQTQITNMAASYNAAASSGALFGQGMTEMVKISADAGLSTQTFSKIIKDNAGDLAKSGLGVAEGARQVAGVGKVMRDSGTTDELLKFGFSLEEQGGLIAQTVAKMRAGGGGAVDQQKVAEATAKYAKDLRTLADLTGEDVKTKEKEVQAAANNLAFQQELAQMAPDQREKIQRAMEAMAPIEQKAFMERMINHGNLMSEETSMAESQSSAFAAKSRANYELALSGQLDLGRQTQLNTEYAAAIQKDMVNAKDIAFAAYAGVESVTQLAKNYNDMLQQALKFTPEGLEASRKAQEELAKKVAEGGDPLTQKFAEITKQGEALKGTLDKLVGTGKAMDLYLSAVEKTTTEMLDYAAKFAGVETSEDRRKKSEQEAKEKAANSKIGEAATKGETLDTSATKFLGMKIGGSEQDVQRQRIMEMKPDQLESAAKNQGVSVDAFLKTLGINGGMAEFVRRQEQAERMATSLNSTMMASGGLATGSEEGFPAMLHGAEAVLPLDNPTTMAKIRTSLFGSSDSIMNMNSKQLASAMSSMDETDRKAFEDSVSKLKEQTSMLDFARPAQQSSDRMMEVMTNKFDEMISLLKDVSNHTELTSSRVA